MTRSILAISHHLLIFGLYGVLFAELVVVRRGMDQAAVAKVARIDLWYGVLARFLIVVVGPAARSMRGMRWPLIRAAQWIVAGRRSWVFASDRPRVG